MRDVNFNFSDDLEKLEAGKDTPYVLEQNDLRRSMRTAGRPRPPPCSSRCPLLAVGLSADTARKERMPVSMQRILIGHSGIYRILVALVVVFL